MIVFRRTLTLIALMFWQGGFMFYGGVVIPVGSQVLGSHSEMSRITQPVTNWLNAAGVVALLFWGCELLCGTGFRRRRLCGLIWLVLAATLAAQFLLHRSLDAFMARETFIVPELEQFRSTHQLYLIVSTAQWALALVLLGLTLGKWRDEDRG